MSEKATLNVRGMTCAACVRRVELGLENFDGVIKAAVNLATEKATVEYDPSRLDVERLSQKVRDLGYDVVTSISLEDPVEKTREIEIEDLKTKFIVGAFLSLVIFMGSMQDWFPFLSAIPRHRQTKLFWDLTGFHSSNRFPDRSCFCHFLC